jgi:hypothetical protein
MQKRSSPVHGLQKVSHDVHHVIPFGSLSSQCDDREEGSHMGTRVVQFGQKSQQSKV